MPRITWRLSAPRPALSLSVVAGVLLTSIILLNVFWLLDRPEKPTDVGSYKDLGSFLHSGAAHREGLNPYAYHPEVQPQPISKEGLNLNPPISVYAFDLMSRIDPATVKLGFIFISCVAYVAVIAALLRAYPEKRNLLVLLAVMALAGLWHMLWYLQLYAPLLLCMVAAWLLIRRGNPVLAGVLIGLVITLKPNYAVVALLLLAAGHYRIALPAAASAAVVTAVPLALDGPSIYQQWLHLSVNFPGVTWTSNASLVSAGARFGVPLLGELLSVAVLVAAVYILWKRRPSALDTLAIGLMTVLLLGPVSWAGYTLFLLPFLFSRKWDRGTWAAVFLLDAPFSPEGAVSSVGKSSSSVAPALVRDVAAAAESAYRAVASAATDAGTAATNIFAPLDAAWNATVHAAQTLYPGMVSVGHPFVSAVLGSIYVWAVLLLLVRFMLEKMQEEPSLQPVQPETASLRDLRL